MEQIQYVFDYVLHLDRHLADFIDYAGIFAYLALFVLIYMETAFVITVFLPSDTVIFAACALASVNSSLSFPLLFALFAIAAALGDSTNFAFGRKLKSMVKNRKKIIFIKTHDIDKVNEFFNKNGSATIIIARFVPVLRSLAPFVTGVSKRSYKWFVKNNVIGVFIWDIFLCGLGFFFGNILFVKDNFGVILIAIMLLTLFTAAISTVISRIFMRKKSEKSAPKDEA